MAEAPEISVAPRSHREPGSEKASRSEDERLRAGMVGPETSARGRSRALCATPRQRTRMIRESRSETLLAHHTNRDRRGPRALTLKPAPSRQLRPLARLGPAVRAVGFNILGAEDLRGHIWVRSGACYGKGGNPRLRANGMLRARNIYARWALHAHINEMGWRRG